jgi:hypothetical protein
MKKYMLLYKGPATAPDAPHDGWPIWFNKVGGQLVDKGSPMAHGLALHKDKAPSEDATSLNGYSIIQAESINDAIQLAKDHPYLALGKDEYSIEIFEV